MAGSKFNDIETLVQPTPRVADGDGAAYELIVAAGPDAGRTTSLDGTESGAISIGTSEACEFRLTDRGVSRRHLAAEMDDAGNLRIRDLGSTNGTTVNGVLVREALLRGGETIGLGGTLLRVERRLVAMRALSDAVSFGRVLGGSREMRRLYPLCERLASSSVPVLIEGETGTGKEVLAEALHEMGPRASGPFVVFDCTATPSNLLESELFGHERGAFTGAVSQRRGVFEEAHGGTLFIDEIGDLEPSMQPKLLRAIERSEVRRLGGTRWMRFDVRILAATRRNLDAEVEHGRFRDDLFHRLAVARIELPPLRARRGDVPVLAREFVRRLDADASAIPPELLARWDRSAWPGNIRELRNAVAKYLALGDVDPSGGAEAAPVERDVIEQVLALDLPLIAARERVVRELERRYIERVLASHGGNVSKAAAASGIARRYFQILRAKTK